MQIGLPDGGGCDCPTSGAGSVRDFAKMIASQPGDADVASQTSAHGVGVCRHDRVRYTGTGQRWCVGMLVARRDMELASVPN